MRLTRLSVKNFLAHRDLDVSLPAPVNLIVGANASGKSSLAAAVEFCLTGTARGLDKKKDAALLASLGSDGKLRVETEWAEPLPDGTSNMATVARSATAVNPPETQLASLFPPDAVRVLLNASRFCELSRAERRDLLRGLGNPDAAVADVAKILSAAGLDPVEASAWAKDFLANPDRAHSAAVKLRQEAGRGADAGAAPASTREIGGKPVDLAGYDPQAVAAQLAKLRADRDAVLAALAEWTGWDRRMEDFRDPARAERAKALSMELDACRVLVEKLGPIRPPSPVAANLSRQITSATDAARKAESDSARAAAELATLTLAPVCPHGKICPPDHVPHDLEIRRQKAEARKKAADAEVGKATGERERLESLAQIEADFGAASRRAREIEALLPGSAEPKPPAGKTREALGADLAAVEDRLQTGTLIQEARAALDRETAAWGARQQSAEAADAQRERWDRVAKALAPEGDARRVPVPGFEAPDMEWAASCLLPGRGIVLDQDGALLLDGVPVEFCSESERWRAGVAVAFGVAVASGLRFLMLDRVDVLAGAAREDFFVFLVEAFGGDDPPLNGILGFATLGLDAPKPSPWPWMQTWLLDGRRIAEVKGETP